MAGNCAHMLDDGGCRIMPDTSNGSGGGVVIDPRRVEGDIVITASVGQGGMNKKDDVSAVQYGLDQVPPVDGGPSPQLKIDGLCGPKTIAAIREFQKKHFGWAGCDGRIDPGKQTLKKLNEKRQRWIKPHLPMSDATDGWLLANMLRHVPHTRNCVSAAIASIKAASNGSFEAEALVNKHFHLGPASAARPALAQMAAVYENMLRVLDAPEKHCTIDKTDEGEGVSTVAFARLGGLFMSEAAKAKIVFRRGSFFASEIPDFGAFVFIHEMRHFVERTTDQGHHAKGWHSDEKMRDLPANQAVLNCDTYAGFALEAHNGEMQRPAWVRSDKFR